MSDALQRAFPFTLPIIVAIPFVAVGVELNNLYVAGGAGVLATLSAVLGAAAYSDRK